MAVQTTVSLRPSLALAGMLADNSNARDILSRICEDAAGLQFGRFVAKGSVAGTYVKGLAAAGDVAILEGVTVAGQVKEASNPDIAQKGEASVLRKGRIWVVAPVVLAVTDALYLVRDGSASAGLLTNVSTGNTAVPTGKITLMIPNTAINGLAMIEVNL